MRSNNASRLRDSAAAAAGSTARQPCCFSAERRHQRSLPERRLCWWRSPVSVHALGRPLLHPAWGRYQYVHVCVTVSPAERQACMGCMQQPATATCTWSNPKHVMHAHPESRRDHTTPAPWQVTIGNTCWRRWQPQLHTKHHEVRHESTPSADLAASDPQLPHTFHTTRLSIQGSGFSRDLYQGSNQVYIGPYPCTILSYLTTDSVITCETIAGDEGTYTVTVVVDGAQSASQCCFSFNTSSTPSK